MYCFVLHIGIYIVQIAQRRTSPAFAFNTTDILTYQVNRSNLPTSQSCSVYIHLHKNVNDPQYGDLRSTTTVREGHKMQRVGCA